MLNFINRVARGLCWQGWFGGPPVAFSGARIDLPKSNFRIIKEKGGFSMQFCNLQHIVWENLSSIISKIRGSDVKNSDKFKNMIDGLKSTMQTFINKLVKDITGEIGINITDYNLDNHDLTHPFEDIFRKFSFSDFAAPGKREEIITQLKTALGKKIGIEENETNLLDFLGKSISEKNIVGEMSDWYAVFKQKVEDHFQEQESAQGQTPQADSSLTDAGARKKGQSSARGKAN